MKKILIVGGTGFIGYHFAKKCLKKNLLVFSISYSKPKKIRFLKKVKYICVDISKKFKLKKKVENLKFDYVVNFGGYVDHSKKKRIIDSHFIGVKNLVQCLDRSNIKSFIQIGSGLEYGHAKSPQSEKLNCKPLSYYASAKISATKYLINEYKKNNLPVTILRLYQIFGPYQDLNRLIPITIYNSILNKTFFCSSGKQLRDFMYISDCIDAVYICLKNKKSKGEIINLGTGSPRKVKDIILNISKVIGSGKPVFNKFEMRDEEVNMQFPSVMKARRILGWKSRVSFTSGLKKTISYYKKNYLNIYKYT